MRPDRCLGVELIIVKRPLEVRSRLMKCFLLVYVWFLQMLSINPPDRIDGQNALFVFIRPCVHPIRWLDGTRWPDTQPDKWNLSFPLTQLLSLNSRRCWLLSSSEETRSLSFVKIEFKMKINYCISFEEVARKPSRI